MNPPKTHDNERVQAFLQPYLKPHELCEDLPKVDDIFSGVLQLKTAGDTSTRSLSRRTLFHILQSCPSIDVASIDRAVDGRYAYNTLAAYAAAARVASKALQGLIERLPEGALRLTIVQERHRLDGPYHDGLREMGLL